MKFYPLGSMTNLDLEQVTERESPNDPDWLADRSIPCESGPELAGLDPTQVGQVIAAPAGDGFRIHARYKPGIPAWAVAGFRGFAAEQIYEFLRQGPNPAGWLQQPDGAGWQLNVSYRQAEQFRDGHLPPDIVL